MARDAQLASSTTDASTSSSNELTTRNQSLPAMGQLAVDRIAGDQRRVSIDQSIYDACVPKLVQRALVESIRSAVAALDDGTYSALRDLLRTCASPQEKGLVLKALSAGHTLDELGTFAAAIHGKSLRWLFDYCTVDRGLRQHWGTTCGPTTVQALHAQYDPIYSLWLHSEQRNLSVVDDNDPEAYGKQVADEQRALLETPRGSGAGGAATSRNNVASGRGRWVDDLLDRIGREQGIDFTTMKDPTPADAVRIIREKVTAGLLTPLIIGNGPGSYGHYVLAAHIRPAQGGGREIMLMDPWDGTGFWRHESTILNGTLNIAGWSQVTGIEVPTRVARTPVSTQTAEPTTTPTNATPTTDGE